MTKGTNIWDSLGAVTDPHATEVGPVGLNANKRPFSSPRADWQSECFKATWNNRRNCKDAAASVLNLAGMEKTWRRDARRKEDGQRDELPAA